MMPTLLELRAHVAAGCGRQTAKVAGAEYTKPAAAFYQFVEEKCANHANCANFYCPTTRPETSLIKSFARRFVISCRHDFSSSSVVSTTAHTASALPTGRRMKETKMRTIILKVIGATLLASLTGQLAAAAEYPARRDHARLVEQYRNSNAHAAPDNFVSRSRGWSEEVESAMTSGIAGH
jgi:hypothetical protein